jgi:hypothetical protein
MAGIHSHHTYHYSIVRTLFIHSFVRRPGSVVRAYLYLYLLRPGGVSFVLLSSWLFSFYCDEYGTDPPGRYKYGRHKKSAPSIPTIRLLVR